MDYNGEGANAILGAKFWRKITRNARGGATLPARGIIGKAGGEIPQPFDQKAQWAI